MGYAPAVEVLTQLQDGDRIPIPLLGAAVTVCVLTVGLTAQSVQYNNRKGIVVKRDAGSGGTFADDEVTDAGCSTRTAAVLLDGDER